MTTELKTIIDCNMDVLTEFFAGIASCEYYDGLSHQLYLDTDDDTLIISQQVSGNDWFQRDDGSLIQIYSVSCYCDTPDDERYTEGCDLYDFGFGDWLEEIESQIAEAING